MRKLVYDVAMTLDGFISHEDGSVDGVIQDGPHVTEYIERLRGYDTVIMGRNTYEAGYRYGAKPGARGYPHMRHYIFSKTLRFGADAQVDVVSSDELAVVRRLKDEDGPSVYLCGGGALAGFLLEHGLIDQLVIKLNPVVFGHGIRLFGGSTRKVHTRLIESRSYDNGVALLRYDLDYQRETKPLVPKGSL
ncbi:MAG TPA: dihydrofolate reductase family protein [Myxococcaceae bacterium]|nr:dihydrofolate reductase family protein [Myxococcaceae bacterium]